MTLTVVHPTALERIAALPAGIFWLYADDDLAVYQRVSDRFGTAQRLLSPADYQARIAELRAPFMQWVDRLLEGESAENWIASSYFKDIFTAPVFLHFVCLVLVSFALNQGRRVLVVTRDGAFARQLTLLNSSTSVVGCRGFLFERLRIEFKAWAHALSRPLRTAIRMVLARRILGQSQRDRLRGAEVLVDTFLLNGDIDEAGKFRDRFLPGLVDWYVAQGIKTASAPYTENIPLRDLAATYRRMAYSATLLAPGELFLTLGDCLTGGWRAICAVLQPPQFSRHPFNGLDVSSIASSWWRIAVLRTVVPRLWTAVPGRMHDCGVAPRFFLDWYENQPIDKAMQIGFQKAGKMTQVVAVRQYFPAANVISFFSSGGEVRSGVSPALNWVCGKRTTTLFAAHDDVGTYQVVPALRYAHLFEEAAVQQEGTALVLFLTSAMAESLGILESVLAAPQETLEKFSRICIKSHQALGGDIAGIVRNRWPTVPGVEVVWESRGTTALLAEACLVVTAGSSVAVEALSRGVPVILSGRLAGPDVNPLEDIDNTLWRTAYGPEEFAALVARWLPELPSRAVRCAFGRTVCTAYFEPATAENMFAFLPQNAG